MKELYALDTDCYSLLSKPGGKVAKRVLEIGDSADLAITVITRIEQLEGRFHQVITAESGEKLLKATLRLQITEMQLNAQRTITLDSRAGEFIESLRNHKTARKVKRRDFLIACICLAHDATLVTRNVKDFKNVPDLRLENWAD